MSTYGPTEQQWEQPDFSASESRPQPTVTGPVYLPVPVHADVPPPTLEERRLGTLRALVWPIALVLCIVLGTWWPLLIVGLLIGGFVRKRLRELRRQRYAGAQLLR